MNKIIQARDLIGGTVLEVVAFKECEGKFGKQWMCKVVNSDSIIYVNNVVLIAGMIYNVEVVKSKYDKLYFKLCDKIENETQKQETQEVIKNAIVEEPIKRSSKEMLEMCILNLKRDRDFLEKVYNVYLDSLLDYILKEVASE